MPRRKGSLILLILTFVALQAIQAEAHTGWSGPSLERGFDRPVADPRQPVVGVTYFKDPDRDRSSMEADLAGHLTLVRYIHPRDNWRWQLDLDAGFFALFDCGDGGTLHNLATDYRVSLDTSLAKGAWQVMLRLGHLSSHPGDWYKDEVDADADTVSWEFLDGLLAWQATSWLRFYGGGTVYLTQTEDAGDSGLQAGFQVLPPDPGWPGGPYLAADFKLKELTDWRLSSSVQAGWVGSFDQNRLRLRFFVFYYAGDNPSGVFQEEWVNRYGLGFGLEY